MFTKSLFLFLMSLSVGEKDEFFPSCCQEGCYGVSVSDVVDLKPTGFVHFILAFSQAVARLFCDFYDEKNQHVDSPLCHL